MPEIVGSGHQLETGAPLLVLIENVMRLRQECRALQFDLQADMFSSEVAAMSVQTPLQGCQVCTYKH